MSVTSCTVGGLDALRLARPEGDEATVLLHGAHLTSWRPARGGERLFLSRASRFAPGEAVRGGVPVIFPQFAERGPLPKHGFARTLPWRRVDDERRTADGTRVELRLDDDERTRAAWPFRFRAELTVELLHDGIDLTLAVWNRGDAPLAFTAALHTYLAVDDARRARLHGLRGTRYESRAPGDPGGVEAREPVEIAGETDRVYLDAPTELRLEEPAVARTTVIAQRGFPDTVLWNPGPERARTIPDLGDDEWPRMLCVEAALVGTPAQLAPREAWSGGQTLVAG